jgi:hypothetical protein
MGDTYRKTKLATQMGTQIHATANYRRVFELIPCGQNIETTRKFVDKLVLSPIPIVIFSRGGCSIVRKWRLSSGNFFVGAYRDRRIHDFLAANSDYAASR